MGSTLRVGFAMGGGVSLGTFNGGALSQALKLLILRGVDRQGRPYDSVVVDVFSGASAGSMSLAVMLRTLVAPDPSRAGGAALRLEQEFGDEFTSLAADDPRRHDLIAAQILQDVQEEIWVREISLERLLARQPGPSGEEAQRRLPFSAGLLDRGAVDELARHYLSFPRSARGKPRIDLSHRRILADRVLFASSLANLTPVVADARGEFPADDVGLLGLSDGLTSNVHRELRVFDLHFRNLFRTGVRESDLRNPDLFPRRWIRYHEGKKIQDDETGKGISTLDNLKAWSRIAATSVASGAVPLAFEPVPLERMDFEFGETENAAASLWPERLKQAGRKRHVFTYIDGGTFNNEPIREAFRLAAYIDAQDPRADFERLILFVDPHFVAPDPSFLVPHHGRWLLQAPGSLTLGFDGVDLERRSSLDRLILFAGTLIRSIMNESRVVEADKIFRTRKRFQLRDGIRRHLLRSLATDPAPDVLRPIAEHLKDLLEQDRIGAMIPAGALSLEGELLRVIVEEAGSSEEPGPLAPLTLKEPAEVAAAAADPASLPAGELGSWLRALTFVAVDRIMDLEGKQAHSRLVAISPAADPAKPDEMETLPGRLLGGFGGFTSERAGRYEVSLARHCARVFLEAAKRISPDPSPAELPRFTDQDWSAYLAELKVGMGHMEGRLVHLLSQSHVPLLGSLPVGILRHFLEGRLAQQARRETEEVAHDLRLRVPSMDYEFDGAGIGDDDIRPVTMGDDLILVTFARFCPQGPGSWSGTHVLPDQQALRVDRQGTLRDREFCTLALPCPPPAEARLSPYPVLMADILESDRGQRVGAERWTLLDELKGLESSILGWETPAAAGGQHQVAREPTQSGMRRRR